MAQRRYCAFVSYRHADNVQEGRRWAEWLHRGLERYVVPPARCWRLPSDFRWNDRPICPPGAQFRDRG
jgi:hypothetical protein